MSKMNDTDPYWRWHDRIGLPRPGSQTPKREVQIKDGIVIVSAPTHRGNIRALAGKQPSNEPIRVNPFLANDSPVPQPIKHYAPAYMALRSAERKVRNLKRALDDEWRAYERGQTQFPFNAETIRKHLRAEVALYKIQFVVLPAQNQAFTKGMEIPTNFPRPRSFARCQSLGHKG